MRQIDGNDFVEQMTPQMLLVAELARKRQRMAHAISKAIKAEKAVTYEQDAASRVGVVSEVDLEIQLLLTAFIRETWSGVRIMAEEETAAPAEFEPGGRYCVLIDPIDGTKPFLAGDRNYCHTVSLMEERRMLASLVYSHAADQLFTAVAGAGTRVIGPGSAPEPLRLVSGGDRVFVHHVRIPAAELTELSRLGYQLGASSQNASDILGMLTNGARAFISFQPMIHDVWSPAMIVREAGGWLSDWQGKEPEFAGNSRIPHLLVAQLASEAVTVLPTLESLLQRLSERQTQGAGQMNLMGTNANQENAT